MTNLLRETQAAIREHNQRLDEVAWVGSADGEYVSTWDEFAALADFDYNSGYGGAVIPDDLVVVFKDGSWLSRGEYDGSEWWDYQTAPVPEANPKKLTKLRGGAWPSVRSVHGVHSA